MVNCPDPSRTLNSEKLVLGLSEVLFCPPSYPPLPSRLSVSADLAPEGQSDPKAGRRGTLSRNKFAGHSALPSKEEKKLSGPVGVYVGVPLAPGHLEGQ